MNVVLKEEGVEGFKAYAIDPYNNEILYFGKVGELEKVMKR